MLLLSLSQSSVVQMPGPLLIASLHHFHNLIMGMSSPASILTSRKDLSSHGGYRPSAYWIAVFTWCGRSMGKPYDDFTVPALSSAPKYITDHTVR